MCNYPHEEIIDQHPNPNPHLKLFLKNKTFNVLAFLRFDVQNNTTTQGEEKERK